MKVEGRHAVANLLDTVVTSASKLGVAAGRVGSRSTGKLAWRVTPWLWVADSFSVLPNTPYSKREPVRRK
jgi:hypothetical protein